MAHATHAVCVLSQPFVRQENERPSEKSAQQVFQTASCPAETACVVLGRHTLQRVRHRVIVQGRLGRSPTPAQPADVGFATQETRCVFHVFRRPLAAKAGGRSHARGLSWQGRAWVWMRQRTRASPRGDTPYLRAESAYAAAKVAWIDSKHPCSPPMLGLQPNPPAASTARGRLKNVFQTASCFAGGFQKRRFSPQAWMMQAASSSTDLWVVLVWGMSKRRNMAWASATSCLHVARLA